MAWPFTSDLLFATSMETAAVGAPAPAHPIDGRPVANEPCRHQHFCIQPSRVDTSSVSTRTGEATNWQFAACA